MQWNLFNHVNKPVKLIGWLFFLLFWNIYNFFVENTRETFLLSLLWHLRVIFCSCRREIETISAKIADLSENIHVRAAAAGVHDPNLRRSRLAVNGFWFWKDCRKYFCLVLRTIQDFFLEHTLNVNFLLIFYQNIKYHLFSRNIILLGHRHTR